MPEQKEEKLKRRLRSVSPKQSDGPVKAFPNQTTSKCSINKVDMSTNCLNKSLKEEDDPLDLSFMKNSLDTNDVQSGNDQVPSKDAEEEPLVIVQGIDILTTERGKQVLHKPWRTTVIVKIMGRNNVNRDFMATKLRSLWQPVGKMQVIDAGNDFFFARFDMEKDYSDVLSGGPWVMLDHNLSVQEWRPEFISCEAMIPTFPVWIRILGLPVEYYHKASIEAIGGSFGRYVKGDPRTMQGTGGTGGKFVRFCVEIDLELPLIPRLRLGGRELVIQYENLHTVCFCCGRFGHHSANCKESNSSCSHVSSSQFADINLINTPRRVAWNCPPTSWVKVNADGESKENGRQAFFGGCIRDEQGKWLLGYMGTAGSNKSNLIAELMSMKEGLDLAWALNYKKLVVESDSLEAIELIKGKVRERYYVAALVADCKKLINQDWSVRIVHITKEANQVADHMANLAVDSSFNYETMASPPDSVQPFLLADSMGI
ncbi:hypothetical protein Scep_009219 [Stephania cephalantha]|uniref:CCHC-type domain-containing protein n=1 Tax=Stephania cephalantha TaxID=152367 RepID=A0AAP0PCC5_9MAGN